MPRAVQHSIFSLSVFRERCWLRIMGAALIAVVSLVKQVQKNLPDKGHNSKLRKKATVRRSRKPWCSCQYSQPFLIPLLFLAPPQNETIMEKENRRFLHEVRNWNGRKILALPSVVDTRRARGNVFLLQPTTSTRDNALFLRRAFFCPFVLPLLFCLRQILLSLVHFSESPSKKAVR